MLTVGIPRDDTVVPSSRGSVRGAPELRAGSTNDGPKVGGKSGDVEPNDSPAAGAALFDDAAGTALGTGFGGTASVDGNNG